MILEFDVKLLFLCNWKVVDVDNVRQRATVKLIPRIDLQALANKIVCVPSFLFLFFIDCYY